MGRQLSSVRVTCLKFYRMYLETFPDNDPSQEPEVDWQQPHPQEYLTVKVLSSHPWRGGMGQGNKVSPEKSSKILSQAG